MNPSVFRWWSFCFYRWRITIYVPISKERREMFVAEERR